MDIRKLQRAIVDGLEDVKGQNIVVFNTEHLSPLFERVIIASGTSNRQTKSLASSVRETVKDRGMQVHRMEGEENGEWIIVDCGAAVVHVMQPAIRDYYHLEELWGDKPVKIKLGDSTTKLVKASEEEPEVASKPAKKVASKKKVAAVAEDAAPAKRTPATRTPATRTPATRTPATRTPATRTAAPAKAPVKTATKVPTKAPTKAPTKKGTVTREVGMKTPATQVFKVGTAKPSTKKADVKKATASKPAAKKAAAPRKTAPRA